MLSRYCRVIDLSCTWYNFPLSLVYAVIYAHRFKASVISSWLYHADSIALAVALLLRKPIVWNIRNNSISHSKLTTKLLVFINSRFSSCTSLTTYNSTFSRNTHLALGYSPRKTMVIHNGFNINANLPVSPCISANDLQVGFAARWDPVKNHRNLIKAFMRFNREYPNSRLHLAGLGMTSENKALTDILSYYSINDFVILYGSVDHINDFYEKLSLHIIPSFSEAFPNTLYESVLHGTPNIYSCTLDKSIAPPTTSPFRPETSHSIYKSIKQFQDLSTSARLELLFHQQNFIKSSFPLTKFVSSFETIFQTLPCT